MDSQGEGNQSSPGETGAEEDSNQVLVMPASSNGSKEAQWLQAEGARREIAVNAVGEASASVHSATCIDTVDPGKDSGFVLWDGKS